MTYALHESIGEPRDEAERAADFAEIDRAIALQAHQLRVAEDGRQYRDEHGVAWCLDCASTIPPQRLKAYPAAVRCAGCQTDYETRRRIETGRRRP